MTAAGGDLPEQPASRGASCSPSARWQFENMSHVLRSVFICDDKAIVLWSHPHHENEEGVGEGQCVGSLAALFSDSRDKIIPLKMGPYLCSRIVAPEGLASCAWSFQSRSSSLSFI